MNPPNKIYVIITALGILFLASQLSIILQSNTTGTMMIYGVTITKATFTTVSGNNSEINLSLINTDNSLFVITSVKVNREICTIAGDNVTLPVGASRNLVLHLNADNYWVNGAVYKMDLYDSSKQLVGSYQALATSLTSPTFTPWFYEYKGFYIEQLDEKFIVSKNYLETYSSPLFSTINEAKEWIDDGQNFQCPWPTPPLVIVGGLIIIVVLGIAITFFLYLLKKK